jgi:hypothetical protein
MFVFVSDDLAVAAARFLAQYAFIRSPTARRAAALMRRLRREGGGAPFVAAVSVTTPSKRGMQCDDLAIQAGLLRLELA